MTLNVTFIVLIYILVKETWNRNFRECRKIYEKKRKFTTFSPVQVREDEEQHEKKELGEELLDKNIEPLDKRD